MIEILYRYQLEDLEELVREVNKQFPRNKRRKRAYLLIGVALVLLPFLAAASLFHPDLGLLWTPPIGLVLICAGWPPSKTRARKGYARLIYDYDYTATISDTGIITRSPTVTTELQWAAFSGYYRTENLFAFTYEAVMYLFPRRAFSPEQWHDFTQMVESKVKAQAPVPN